MPLARLLEIVPPPAIPTAATGDIAAIEAELGTKLPPDYPALVATYGYGTFVDFLHLWSPFFAPCPMVAQARGVLDADRSVARMSKKAVPFPQFPDPEGALPFANTDNGDVVYWLTWGEPDAWPVAVWNPRRGETYDLVEGGAVAFLTGWLGGAFACKVFSDDLDFRDGGGTMRPCFDPWRERTHTTLTLQGTTDAPYATRLEALTRALAPVEMRGSYGDDEEEKRQVHWVANGGAWRLTYDTVYGHNVRLAAPADEVDRARGLIAGALAPFGLAVR